MGIHLTSRRVVETSGGGAACSLALNAFQGPLGCDGDEAECPQGENGGEGEEEK